MRSPIVSAAVIALVGSLLSACGTSEYCQTIDASQKAFNDAPATADGFRVSASLMRKFGKLAPEEVKDDYEKIADNLEHVASAQDELGVSIEEMRVNPDKVKDLSTAEQATLSDAYVKYNALADARVAVDTNIKQECEITLK